MNRVYDLWILGWLTMLVGGFLLVPAVLAPVLSGSAWPFVAAASLALIIGGGIVKFVRFSHRRLRPRDGYLVVAGSWLVISLFGALPYVFSGSLGPIDAFFETASGFTTTGSTVVADIAGLPQTILLWRSMTQWLGGMGIILFTIAILPLLGIGGMQLFRAEVPGPVKDKVMPRLANTARALWGLYVGLTLAETLALRLCGMSWFDAVNHSLTTLATGGFSTMNSSIGEYGSPAIEWVITLFMLLAGVNFVLHFKIFTGRGRSVIGDAELRYYLGMLGAATVVLSATIWTSSASAGEAIRKAAFQAVSLVTTTGYASADFEQWPPLAAFLVIILLTLGGMAGSTGGGIKSLRIVLAFRSLRMSLHRLIHPHAVRLVKYNGEAVPESVLSGVWAFLTAYFMLAAMAAALVAAHGYDVETALTVGLTAIGNVGPGLGEIGAMDNFAHFSADVKIVLALVMIAGRLEIFTILALFTREFWRK